VLTSVLYKSPQIAIICFKIFKNLFMLEMMLLCDEKHFWDRNTRYWNKENSTGVKVSKSSIKARLVIHRLKKYRLETGFSMLEAVVVVGVLLALAVGGFFAYGPITENAKRAKVKFSASEVHTGVLAANIDGDPSTTPQGVIDTWNASAKKIRVEILEPVAASAAMSATVTAPSTEADFCVQATNVESPHITAREGACSDVTDGSAPDGGGAPTAPLPDADSDGIPDATDSDIDNNGVPNTVWESYSVVKDKQAAGDEVSYVNSDGSTTTWNYNDAATYGHPHDPTNPNLLSSGLYDILRIDKTNPNRINVTVGTNGNMHNGTGAVGGSFAVWMHGDLTCRNNATGVITPRYAYAHALLKGLYLAVSPVPGPNTGGLIFDCQTNETVTGFTLYPDRYVDWATHAYSYYFTKDQIVNWKPAGG
jgi:hypothetical protein